VQQYVLTLGNWLSSRGHDVHYLAGETRERDLANLHSLSRNVAVRYNHNSMSTPLPANRQKTKSLLNKRKFDLLHVMMPYSPLLAGRIIDQAPESTAIVGTFHILPYSKAVWLGMLLVATWENRGLNKFDKILSVSPAAQVFAKAVFKLESEVVPNFVTINRFARARQSYKKEDKLTILFLGRLVPRKGCLTLLRAVKQLLLSKNLPKFEVVICGAGPLLTSLMKYAKINGLSKIVKFVGYVPEEEKPARLASADIAVFPSSGGESFGIVLIEAMASGKSVVLAGRNPGYESVLGGQPELLFDASDVDELAKKLEHYILDANLRKEHADWCRHRAIEFDVDRVGPSIERIYKQVADSKKVQHNLSHA
ncbi:MAG: glycosyltransferase family 4 protein, partial [Candidatus Saccharimonadales bacterium]